MFLSPFECSIFLHEYDLKCDMLSIIVLGDLDIGLKTMSSRPMIVLPFNQSLFFRRV